MIDLMEEGYNKEIDLYSRDINSHYHYLTSPCILPPDHRKHDNSQHTLSFSYHRTVVQNVTPLAYCQIDLQKNFDRNSPNGFQMKYPQFDLKFLNLKPYILQQKYNPFLQQNQANTILL